MMREGKGTRGDELMLAVPERLRVTVADQVSGVPESDLPAGGLQIEIVLPVSELSMNLEFRAG